jgi:prenyltransferase beta subunit
MNKVLPQMKNWLKELRVDPIPCLISSKNETIEYFVKRDLLGERVESTEILWKSSEVEKIINRQQEDGSWRYPGGGKEHLRSQEDYNQLETYRVLGQLVEKYGLNNQHTRIRKAAAYVFSCQTKEGDFRGIYGNQYSPNYSAAIMELLIKAGYDGDPRIDKGFQWLLSICQDDGGWAIPLRTVGAKWADTLKDKTIEPDLTKPFSHLITGVVLRAFAASPRYSKSAEAVTAGKLLASRFFKKDIYPDRNTPEYWERVSFPFWFTDIVAALDSLSLLGFTRWNQAIDNALSWLKQRQRRDGTFEFKILRDKDKDAILWITLAVCRILKRLHEQSLLSSTRPNRSFDIIKKE